MKNEKKERDFKIIILLAIIAICLLGYYEYYVLCVKLDAVRVKADNPSVSYNRNVDLEGDRVEKAEDKPDFKLTAKAALLLDGSSNHVLYEKNGKERLPMASTTKIMTCIIALEYGKLDDEVVFSKYAASQPDVQLNATAGQKFTLYDLLHSLMLESHNDTAVAIAEHIGGSVEGFAKLMNKKAEELGLKDTNFVTPNGLDAKDHYTTAYELALIASYAIKNERFLEIINSPNWTLKELTKNTTYSVVNKNRFLSLMDGAIGLKTGFTNNAGYCFVGGLKRDGKTLISVVLGAGWPPHKTYKWKDTQLLMNYGLDHFGYRNVSEGLQKIKDIPVLKGKDTKISVAYNADEKQVLLRNSDAISIVYDIPETLTAPINKGEQIGSITYYINGEKYEEIKVTSKTTVQKIDFAFCLDRIINLFVNCSV